MLRHDCGDFSGARSRPSYEGLFAEKHRDEMLAAGAVVVVEAGEARAVEVEDAGDAAILDQRHHQLRLRDRVAGDMAGEGVDVGYQNGLAARRGGAADAVAPGDAKAGPLALT